MRFVTALAWTSIAATGAWSQAADTNPAGDTPPGRAIIFSEDFRGALQDWDTGNVDLDLVEGSAFFSVLETGTLMLMRPIPLDDVTVEFDGWADANGIIVYLISSVDRHYRFSLGMGGNQFSSLVDGDGGNALNTVAVPVFTAGHWHRYRIERRGATLAAYCDDRLIVSADSASDYQGEGLLAFGSQHARIGLANLVIYQPATAAEDALAPMELDDDSSVKKAVVCLGFDDRGGLDGVQEVYPDGTEQVGLYLEIKSAAPNSEIRVIWHHEGNALARQIMTVTGDQKSIGHLSAVNRHALWPGNYQVEIRENGRLVARRIFAVR